MNSKLNLIPVLILDDQLVQREGVAKIVEATGTMRVVGMASTAEEAYQIFQYEPAELALVDLVLQGQRGTAIGRTLRQQHPTLKVIIYTREKSMILAAEIFRERKGLAQPGLQGYILTRNISSSQYLINVYDQIIHTGYYIDPDVLRSHYQLAEIEPLTRREEECALLVAGGLGNADIARRMVISHRRVENIISSLYQKFKISGDPGDPSRRVLLAEGVKILYSHHIPFSQLRLVIIEDNADYLARLKREVGNDSRLRVVATASSGQLGIEVVDQQIPDVVLVDIHLPDMDGFRAVRQILMERPQTKIIMQSAASSTTYLEEALSAGAIALLPKNKVTASAIVGICFPDAD
jgi:two-component system, NarL family, nitrate/nitrite response regulator NarL